MRKHDRVSRARLAALVLALGAFIAACSPQLTAQHYNKPVEQVTPADQMNAMHDWRLIVQHNAHLSCIRYWESDRGPWPHTNGYYTNTGNGYIGPYQYVQSTWDAAARMFGRHDLVGVPPAEPYIEWWLIDEITLHFYDHPEWGGGPGHWGNRC